MVKYNSNHIKNGKLTIATTTLTTGGICSYISNIAKEFKSLNWQVDIIVTNSRGNLFNNFNAKYNCHDLTLMPLSLRKIIRAADIINLINSDIILINHCSLINYTLPLLNKSIKPVSVIHSDDSRFYQLASIFEDRIFRWVAPTTSVAQYALHYLSDKNRKRVAIIPHGVDDEVFNTKKNKSEMNHSIAFVGFVAPNKGADLLFPIMQRVLLKHPTAHLHIIGYGPLEDEIKNHFVQQGYGNNLTITGRVPPQKVAEILAKADIFLLPTRIEGFGLAIVEAMMCGAVPVVSRLVGITDTIVTENETGILVEVDNVESFSSAIVNLLLNPERMNLMRQAAQKTAQEKFTLQRMISDYQQLFAEKDDWTAPPQRGKVGWTLETLHEMTRKNPDGTFRFKKKYQTVKHILTS